MKSKSIFKSKAAFASTIAIAAGALGWSGASDWLSDAKNAQMLLIGAGVLNLAIRFVTKDRVSIFGDD
jgi:hypothetical protein